jgi:hypothetical protein
LLEFTALTTTQDTSNSILFNIVDINLSASQVSISFFLLPITSYSFPTIGEDHFFTLTDLDWVGVPTGVITGLSLVSSNFFSTPTVSNVTDHGFQITVSRENDYYLDPNNPPFYSTLSATWDILTRHEENPTTVIPEPTTMALLGAGAAGLIARRRRLV